MAKSCRGRFNDLKGCVWDMSQAKYRNDVKTDTFVLSGLISKFCLSFDLSWKVMKDFIIEYHGVTDFAVGSPRETLEKAFSLGIIDDDGTWLTFLRLRNDLSHDYDSSLAYDSVDVIISHYIDIYVSFVEQMEELMKKI